MFLTPWTGRYSRWRFLLAGLFWAAAVASRITQAVPIVLILVILLVRTAQLKAESGAGSRPVAESMAVLLPLGLGASLLGWYNWIRFGSVVETGYRYALAGNVPIQANGASVFSPAYVLQNLRNYLFNPPMLHPAFPFLAPARGMISSVTPLISLPALYNSQWVTGLLFGAPLLLLALVPMVHLVMNLRRRVEHDEVALRWLIAILAACSLGSLSVLLTYFWVAERFLLDFIPGLLLLSAVGSWQTYRLLGYRWHGRVLHLVFVLVLMAPSILTTTLLAISINAAGFRELNPVLWHQLSNLVRH